MVTQIQKIEPQEAPKTKQYANLLREIGLPIQAMIVDQKESYPPISADDALMIVARQIWPVEDYPDSISLSNLACGRYHDRHKIDDDRVYLSQKMGVMYKGKRLGFIRLGLLSYFKNPLPYGVALKIKELQDKKVFDEFVIAAETSCFRDTEPSTRDPVLLGLIKDQHFLIACWEPKK